MMNADFSRRLPDSLYINVVDSRNNDFLMLFDRHNNGNINGNLRLKQRAINLPEPNGDITIVTHFTFVYDVSSISLSCDAVIIVCDSDDKVKSSVSEENRKLLESCKSFVSPARSRAVLQILDVLEGGIGMELKKQLNNNNVEYCKIKRNSNTSNNNNDDDDDDDELYDILSQLLEKILQRHAIDQQSNNSNVTAAVTTNNAKQQEEETTCIIS